MPFQLSSRRFGAPALSLSLAAAMMLIAAPQGASAQTAASPAPAAEAPVPAPVPATADTVVAVVNGQDVTLGELIIMRGDLPEQYQSRPTPQIMEALLSRIAVETALAAKAGEEGLDQTLFARLRAKIDARSRLAESRIRQVIEAAATPEALRAAYDAMTAAYVPVEEVRASHILVVDKALADEIRAKLDAGASFADLAAEHGTDGTKAQGGDLGWFEQTQMVPEFATAAFAAEEGAFVGPIQTQFGWHLIHVTGKRQRPAPSYDESVAQISEQLSNEAAEAEITAVRAAADVQRPEGQPAPDAIRDESLLKAN
jgi:peptidyl-prolyl cis-trans isomerase C